MKVLKIEGVTIRWFKQMLIFVVPKHFTGIDLVVFKRDHKDEIEQFLISNK